MARRPRRRLRRDAARADHFAPARAILFERRIIHFAHPRIDAGDHARRARFLRDRFQRRYAEHWQITRQREALRDSACNAQARERTGPGAERHCIEPRRRKAGVGEQSFEHRQRELRVALAGAPLERRDLAIAVKRYRTPFGRCLKCCETHGDDSIP